MPETYSAGEDRLHVLASTAIIVGGCAWLLWLILSPRKPLDLFQAAAIFNLSVFIVCAIAVYARLSSILAMRVTDTGIDFRGRHYDFHEVIGPIAQSGEYWIMLGQQCEWLGSVARDLSKLQQISAKTNQDEQALGRFRREISRTVRTRILGAGFALAFPLMSAAIYMDFATMVAQSTGYDPSRREVAGTFMVAPILALMVARFWHQSPRIAAFAQAATLLIVIVAETHSPGLYPKPGPWPGKLVSLWPIGLGVFALWIVANRKRFAE
jgi:hypothetical protein